MTTVHERAVRRVADQLLGEHQVWRDVAYEVFSNMKAGLFPRVLVDAFVQKDRGGYDIYDAYCVTNFLMMMQDDKLAIVIIPMERGPYADRMIEENDAVLAKLPSPALLNNLGLMKNP